MREDAVTFSTVSVNLKDTAIGNGETLMDCYLVVLAWFFNR